MNQWRKLAWLERIFLPNVSWARTRSGNSLVNDDGSDRHAFSPNNNSSYSSHDPRRNDN
ncbi:hypothetical protein JCGZ_08313 [Jatropha curcas]|uniref:Uncharacterized protein n=1 Tax=Jatropha curcas TaxID=180498 RepID=A0A067KJX6_JATCU|nr:hypothetical protein JCGZ_08313 [Jatropha curcas]